MTDFDTIDGGEGDGDELALPRFEERLRLRLAAAHRAHTAGNGSGSSPLHLDTPAPATARTGSAGDPDGGWGGGPLDLDTASTATPGSRGGNRRQRRAARRSLRVGVGGLAAAAAAAVVVTAVTRGPGAGDEVAGGPGTPGSPDDLATRIISASQEAEATMVVHVTQDNTGYGDDDQWYDETTGSHRLVQHYEDGRPSMDSAGDEDSSIVVDHCFSEYLEGPALLPTGPGSATDWVQRGLENGSITEEGTEVVEGRELIRLVQRLSNLAVPEPGEGEVIVRPTPDGAEGDTEAWSDEAAGDIAALEDRFVDDVTELLATAEDEAEAAATLDALRTELVDDVTELLPTAGDHIEQAELAALEENLAEAVAGVRADPGDRSAEEIAAVEALVAELVADAQTRTAISPTTDPDAEAQADPDAQAGAESDADADADADEILGITLVDPETYRPVRRIGYPDSDYEYVQDFEYLSRSPENLAHLEVEVPAGYTPVEQLRGDGERFDAGCV